MPGGALSRPNALSTHSTRLLTSAPAARVAGERRAQALALRHRRAGVPTSHAAVGPSSPNQSLPCLRPNVGFLS